MDLNLNLGLPLCPPPLSVDLGYDLALNDFPFQSSEIDDVLMRIPSVHALHPFGEIPDLESRFEPFELPPYDDTPPTPTPSEERITDDNALNSDLPEHRFRTILEPRQPSEMGRAQDVEEHGGDTNSATDPERLMRDISRSGRMVGSIGRSKASDKALMAEASSGESKEKNYFDCNICFEVANEPVVTCCGHLFCWPCLYQWLHVHCNYKECPVCKGKVNESDVVPIYGRGGSETGGARENAEEGGQGLKIPPRPQGNRVESLRQQLPGLLLRRSEASIIQEMQHLFNQLPETFRFLRREERNPPPPQGNVQAIPPATATSPLQTGTSAHQPHRPTRRRRRAAIAQSDDLPDPAPSPSQASTSSTMAMIQGEIAAPDSSVEHEMGGTSMVLRRRTRSRSSGANEQGPQLRRRRRN